MEKKNKLELEKILREKETFFTEEPGKHKVMESTHSHERFTLNKYYLSLLLIVFHN